MIFLGTDARGFMKAQQTDLEEHELLLMQLVRFADTENISKELILEGLETLEDRMGLAGKGALEVQKLRWADFEADKLNLI